MNASRQDNTIAVIGLILAIIAALFSFIPCLGLFAIIPGVIGLVLGVVAYMQAKDGGYPKGMPIAVIVISAIACLIVGGQILFFKSAASSAKESTVKYTDCAELEAGYDALKVDLIELTNKMEQSEDISVLSTLNKFVKLQAKMINMAEQSEEMDCGLDFQELEKELKESQEKTLNGEK